MQAWSHVVARFRKTQLGHVYLARPMRRKLPKTSAHVGQVRSPVFRRMG